MKLVLAIVKDDDAFDIMDTLNIEGFSVTKLASTGGFLKVGNTTLICGVEDEKVDNVIEIIKQKGKSKSQIITQVPMPNATTDVIPTQVTVGGATIFVLDVDKFIKI